MSCDERVADIYESEIHECALDEEHEEHQCECGQRWYPIIPPTDIPPDTPPTE